MFRDITAAGIRVLPDESYIVYAELECETMVSPILPKGEARELVKQVGKFVRGAW